MANRQLKDVSGADLKERVQSVFESDPSDSYEAGKLLDQLIEEELLRGKFGLGSIVAFSAEDARKWITTLIVAAVSRQSEYYAENGYHTEGLFIDEWINRRCPSANCLVELPGHPTPDERFERLLEIWSSDESARQHIKAALYRDVLHTVEQHPILAPEPGAIGRLMQP